jgi:arsenate reductase
MPLKILALCTGNAARSQIAEALLTTLGAGRVEATSAGTRPASRVHPGAIDLLARHGIEWEGRAPKSLSDVEGIAYDLVITVCDNARDACPYFPGAHAQVHWGLPDPTAVEDPEVRERAFDETYDVLEARIRQLLAMPLETMEKEELGARARAIGAASETEERIVPSARS